MNKTKTDNRNNLASRRWLRAYLRALAAFEKQSAQVNLMVGPSAPVTPMKIKPAAPGLHNLLKAANAHVDDKRKALNLALEIQRDVALRYWTSRSPLQPGDLVRATVSRRLSTFKILYLSPEHCSPRRLSWMATEIVNGSPLLTIRLSTDDRPVKVRTAAEAAGPAVSMLVPQKKLIAAPLIQTQHIRKY